MGNGLVNVRDQKFILFEQIGIEKLFNSEKYGDYTVDDANMMLGEAEKLAVNVMAPTYAEGDKEGCTFTEGKVKVPSCYHAAYKKICETGWFCASRDPEVGGQGMPLSLFSACAELFDAANFALMMYPGLTCGAAALIEKFGTEAQKKKYMYKMYAGEFGGTMCLTEPGAGSDVGALRTKAVKQADGSYKISGTKMFISSGDHDLTGNNIHAVLARIEGDPVGTDGISIFIVPKVLVNADGSLGAPNDVVTGNIEHKMGIKGSATCTLNFGEEENCVGELLGRERQGMEIMFHMMNEARLEVGMQGLGHSSAAFEHARDYARERVQSRAVWDMTNPAAPAVTIIEHPDVRRTLLWMKAYVEGMRALNYYVAYAFDRAEIAQDQVEKKKWLGVVELLTPVCKAFSSDKGVEICSLAIDIYGGYGYCSEYPVEQYLRDVKIACIYEGTNGIQALDLVGRKLAQNHGENLKNMFAEIGKTAAVAGADPQLQELGGALAKAAQALGQVSLQFKEWADGSGLVLPILNARPFLGLLGDLLVGWQLVQGAQVAAASLNKIYTQAGAQTSAERRSFTRNNADAAFYEGKIASATYFASTILPTIKGRCLGILAGDRTPIEMLDASFG
ncbi:MAG: acyl-CoA dehydrogenase [Deltaproteobacteria bacterium]|nr:acyl-CoA dehydrogenase [Deltaproteobacteria bacterium]